jgi:hypothetical protein
MPPPAVPASAVVAQAARRSRVCWLTYDAPQASVRDRLVWHAWYDEAVLVVADEDQPLPGIGEATSASLTFRSKESRARLVAATVDVARVDPGDSTWEPAAAALLAVRLNLPDPTATAEHWRSAAVIVRLTPVEQGTESVTGPLP